MRRLGVAIAMTGSLLAAGCSTSPAPKALDSAVQRQLRADVQAVVQAVQLRHYAAAQSALDALGADLAAARAAGKVSDTKLAEIRAAMTRVQADFAAATAPQPRRIVVTVTTSPTPPSDGGGNGHDGGGKKHGGD